MKENKLSNLSLEALEKSKKTLKLMTIMLAVMLTILLCTSLYITVSQKFTPLLIVPLALSPILFLNIYNLKNITKEIQSRK